MLTDRSMRLLATFLLLLPPFAWAQGFVNSANHVQVSGYLSRSAARPGDRLAAAVILEIQKGFHVNAHQPSLEYLIPTTLSLEAPEGIAPGPVQYPKALVKKFGFADQPLKVYEGRTVLRFDLEVDSKAAVAPSELKGKVRVQACDQKSCYAPANIAVSIRVPMAAKGAAVEPTHVEIFRPSR
jgi:thiol:disulfide interchange protein DsbD